MQNTARILTFAVLIIGVVITLLIIVHTAGGLSLLLSLILLGFAAWAMVPYLVLLFSARLPTSSKVSWVILGSTLVIVDLGVIIYIDAFFVHLDPQSGLVFIFVPLYQLILACLMFFVSMLLNRPVKNNHESKTT